MGGSSGQKNISQQQIRGLQILVPPMAEQCRIVAIVSAHDGRITGEQEQLEKLRFLKEALALDLITGRMRTDSGSEGAA